MKTINMTLLLIFMTTVALASDLTVQGGWEHLGSSNYGDAPQVNLRLESKILKDLNIGIEGGYHGNSYHTNYGSLTGYSVLGETIYNIPVKWKIKPYLLGGVGWSWWHFNRNQDMVEKGIEIHLGDSLAYKVAVGFDYQIKNNWSINVEWSYFKTNIPKDSFYSSTGKFANVLGDNNKSGRIRIGEEEMSLLAGVKYSW